MTSVAILVFADVDLLDVGGPYEVFLTADRLARRAAAPYRYDVTIAGPSTDPITAYGGMTIVPAVAAAELSNVDIAVLPGAIAIERVLERDSIMAAARHLSDSAVTNASVCTGAFILGALGALTDRAWTTHFEDVGVLADRISSTSGSAWVRWVDTGDVITSGGLSSGIAMALHLVERTADRDLAVATARQIEYTWDPDEGVLASG